MVFLTRLRFMYVSQACHFYTNQVHVGGALAERHEINKSSLEILFYVYYKVITRFFSCNLE